MVSLVVKFVFTPLTAFQSEFQFLVITSRHCVRLVACCRIIIIVVVVVVAVVVTAVFHVMVLIQVLL